VYELSIGILALAGALLAAQHTNLAAMALVLMPMGVIVFWLLAGHLKIKL
jgi:hypothetical protein